MLDETIITRAIIESYTKEFINYLKSDVIIAGAGPAGLVASKFLAEAGLKTIIFERKLSFGGGMLGGGIMFNKIVVQDEAKRILDLYNIKSNEYEPNYHVADAVESVAKLTSGAVDAGVKIFNLLSVEDVKINQDNHVTGVVINWTAVEMAKLHIDPVTFESKCVVDATGHNIEVIRTVLKKIPGAKLNTPTGEIIGELPMHAEIGEKILIETTKEIYPGLYVAGMAANACSGGQRMGPIFGGMLLSGEKVAQLIIEKLKK
ncbi:MAG: sulfide-dependent adenosine diphosphate thiazole synthase [Promethearchaeota archaeon]